MKKKGFTLVELLAVFVIMGIIIAIVIPAISSTSSNNKASKCKNKVQIVSSALEAFRDLNNNSAADPYIKDLINGEFMGGNDFNNDEKDAKASEYDLNKCKQLTNS